MQKEKHISEVDVDLDFFGGNKGYSRESIKNESKMTYWDLIIATFKAAMLFAFMLISLKALLYFFHL